VARDFKPSEKSLSPVELTLRDLRFLQKAAPAVEARIKKDGTVPPWVSAKIRESAVNLGLAVSYLQHQNSKEKK
jgi:hypothetical protein